MELKVLWVAGFSSLLRLQNPFNGIERTPKTQTGGVTEGGIHSMELKGSLLSIIVASLSIFAGIHSMELKG